jgi:hypothetical protein
VVRCVVQDGCVNEVDDEPKGGRMRKLSRRDVAVYSLSEGVTSPSLSLAGSLRNSTRSAS